LKWNNTARLLGVSNVKLPRAALAISTARSEGQMEKRGSNTARIHIFLFICHAIAVFLFISKDIFTIQAV